MLGYLVRRALWIIPVLWAVATITFLMMHAVPGGPFSREKQLPPAVVEALNRRYQLDEPLWRQYGTYLWNASHFDFGVSYRGDRDAGELIGEGVFVTLQLGVMGFALASAAGLTLGVVSALNRNGPLDYLGVLFATIGASLPSFVMAAFLSVVFAVNLGWFKILGWGGPAELGDVFDPAAWDVRKLVLPVISASTLSAAYIARVTRASLLEVLHQDYVRTARAKGLPRQTVAWRHALKNAMVPILTVMGPTAAAFITGSFIVESMFSIPGVGRASVDAIMQRDYSVIMGATLFYAAVFSFASLAVDVAYAAVDPRIRYR